MTSRCKNAGNEYELREALPAGMLIIFCDHNAKDEVALAAGHEIDIWIDDIPESIRPYYQ